MGAAGAPKTGGRKRGTLNAKTRDLLDILNARGYCPVADLIETAAIAKIEYERVSLIEKTNHITLSETQPITLVTKNRFAPDTSPIYLKIIQESAASILPYLYPKRKAIQFEDPNGTAANALTEIFKRLADRK